MTEFHVGADDVVALIRTVTSFQALLVLDHAWTNLVTGSNPSSEEGEAALVTIAGQMLVELPGAATGAAWLQDFVVRTGASTIREGFREAASRLPEDIQPLAGDLDEVYGEQIGGLAETAYNGLRPGLADQRRTLVRELFQSLGGESSSGDLLPNILCSIAAGALVAGVVMTAVPPFVHGPPVAAAGGVAYRAFKCKLDDLEKGPKWRLR